MHFFFTILSVLIVLFQSSCLYQENLIHTIYRKKKVLKCDKLQQKFLKVKYLKASFHPLIHKIKFHFFSFVNTL